MCPKLIELLSWNGPTVHVCCFMLARASTKTFVSRGINILSLIGIYFQANIRTSLYKSLCVFLYSMYTSAQYINIISMIPNYMNKKINIHFSDFCSAGSSLHFVTTDPQTSYHNLSFRFLSLYSFISFYYTKVVSPFPIFTFLCPQRQTVYYSRDKACALYCSQQATVQLPMRADTLKHVRPVVISNSSVASRMGQAVTGSNLFVAATEKLPVRPL